MLLLGVSHPTPSGAFLLNGFRWPVESDIVLRLGLSRPLPPLQDGFPSWNASAIDAMNLWNAETDGVRLVDAGPSSPGASDGINSVFFSNNIYGDSFGPNLLAVTVNFSTPGSGAFTEADVIFNTNREWNSYRGPQQAGVIDFHRVALHEFGHVLGLAHPDAVGQTVSALMNSIISDLDGLTQDDGDGARSIYNLPLTSSLTPPSVLSGDPFTYQITAANNPTSFTASGLPPGLVLNSATGVISGRPTSSGTFLVSVIARGTGRSAFGRVQITINPLPLTSTLTPPFIPIGNSFSYQISAGNNPTSFAAIGLPAGLTLDPNTGFISGTATVTGHFPVTLIARGANSEASARRRNLGARAEITNERPPEWAEGNSVATRSPSTHPVSRFTATGLPAGIQLNESTGLLSGTASPIGFFRVEIEGETAFGVVRGSISFTISPPRLLGTLVLRGDIGSVITYQVAANNQPTFLLRAPVCQRAWKLIRIQGSSVESPR